MIYDVKEFKQHKADSMESIAGVVATNSITPLLFQDNESAAKNLSELQNATPEIIGAIIYDSLGKVFASYNKSTEPINYPQSINNEEQVFKNNQLFVLKKNYER